MGKARIAVANRFNKSIDDFRLNAVSEVPRRCNIGKAPPSVRDFFVLCERIQYQREEADILLKDFGEGLGAMLGPRSPEPDVLNYSWRDYGNRVGVWRCLDLFESLKLPLGALINTSLYDYCPEVVEAFVKRGDELIGHGHTNADRQASMTEKDEKRLLKHCRDRIRKESRAPGRVWPPQSGVRPLRQENKLLLPTAFSPLR